MLTQIKTAEEIEIMRQCGKVLGKVLFELNKFLKEGIDGEAVDKFAEEFIRDHGMIPAFKGYNGFPATVCFCINHEVVHGIPSKKQVIKDGDIVTVDAGVIYKGFYTDSAVTYLIGNVDPKTVKFVNTCKESLYNGIDAVKAGNRFGDIGSVIEKTVTKQGYKVIKELVGHGIGKNLHEEPHVANHGKADTGPLLKAGMTLAIEPIIGISNGRIHTLQDNWMIETTDKSLSCQWEHTILVTEDGAEILTLREDEIV